MLAHIENFKSIKSLTLKLKPLTILVGPPASGKSNILDALLLSGYFSRFARISEEYGNDASNLEPFGQLLRFNDPSQLFHYHQLDLQITIHIEYDKNASFDLKIYYERGNVVLNVDGLRFGLQPLAFAQISGNKQLAMQLSNVFKKLSVFEARLYGYDRLGLGAPYCTSPVACGFAYRIRCLQAKQFPYTILSEFAWNICRVIRSSRDIIIELNNTFRDVLGERIEVKVLRNGVIVVFDYDIEVDASLVSDSVLRTLYHLFALKTAVNYAKRYGLERKLLVLLEEPEVHTFPFLLDVLARHIAKAIRTVYVVLTTHNPLLVSKLWDYVRDVKTYYVYRGKDGTTYAEELNVEKMAKDLVTADEILYMTPHEVLEKYVEKPTVVKA